MDAEQFIRDAIFFSFVEAGWNRGIIGVPPKLGIHFTRTRVVY
jgi:hypothetical protein